MLRSESEPSALSADLLRELQQYPELTNVLLILALEQAGVMPLLVRRNPDLGPLLTQFFTREIEILVVGGESGMGKSLMATEIRRLHRDLQLLQIAEVTTQLCIITWDRTHQAFFEEVSTEIGGTIALPRGETPPTARKLISTILADQITFARKYLGPRTLVLIEAPLIDSRGETIFSELAHLQSKIATIIMHSPVSRDETLQEGRLLHTSAQSDAMTEMREKLIERIMGPAGRKLSVEAQETIIKEWWIEQLMDRQGVVVEWDPSDDRQHFENTVNFYRNNWLRPDVLAPRALSRFTRGQLESIFRTLPDIDALLKEVIG